MKRAEICMFLYTQVRIQCIQAFKIDNWLLTAYIQVIKVWFSVIDGIM